MTFRLSSLASPIPTFGAFVVAAGLVYYLSGYVFFGLSAIPLLVLAVASFAVFFASGVSMPDRKGKNAFLAGLVIMAAACVSMVPSNLSVEGLQEVLAASERNLGHPPPIAATIEPMVSDISAYRANKSLVRSYLRGGRTQPQEVMDFIRQAREFGVDVRFVAENGIVRVSDKQAVYRAALARATQGDERAIAFLEENFVP